MNKSHLKYLIKEVLQQEGIVDEPEGSVFGKVLFGPDRIDNVEPEPNTKEEESLYKAIVSHYSGYMDALENKHKNILALIKQGKFLRLLRPPEVVVYRYLDNVPLKVASQILGCSIRELKKNAGTFQHVNVERVFRLRKNQIQSWTTTPVARTLSEFIEDLQGGNVSMIIEADTRKSGKFMMNPDFVSKISSLKPYTYQHEVISVGPIKILRATYICNLFSSKQLSKIDQMSDFLSISAEWAKGAIPWKKVLKGLIRTLSE